MQKSPARYEPLHLKYRPHSFSELCGQESIAITLANAVTGSLKSKRQAYLFCGSRGTGKTSSARILAKSLNCIQTSQPTATPCQTCVSCQMIGLGNHPDIIEIDAASRSGVDNIRELIERVQYSPQSARSKVYIIDEVHGLSKAAQEALLKTLEEPPSHVVFVLCTTEPERLQPTITSRCLRFDFKRISHQDIVYQIDKIASIENIPITSDAVSLIAKLSNGAMRDALTLLDQLSLLVANREQPIYPDDIWKLVGAISFSDLLALTQAIVSMRADLVQNRVKHLIENGKEPLTILDSLVAFWVNLSVVKTAPGIQPSALSPDDWEQTLKFVDSVTISVLLGGIDYLRSCFAQLKSTNQPILWIEVILVAMINRIDAVGFPLPKNESLRQPETSSKATSEKMPPTASEPEASSKSTKEITPLELGLLVHNELKHLSPGFAQQFFKFVSVIGIMPGNIFSIHWGAIRSLFKPKLIDQAITAVSQQLGISYQWQLSDSTSPPPDSIKLNSVKPLHNHAAASGDHDSLQNTEATTGNHEIVSLPSMLETESVTVQEAVKQLASFFQGDTIAISNSGF